MERRYQPVIYTHVQQKIVKMSLLQHIKMLEDSRSDDKIVITIIDETKVEINIRGYGSYRGEEMYSDTTYKCTWELYTEQTTQTMLISLLNFPQYYHEYVDREPDQITFASIEKGRIIVSNEYVGTYSHPITLSDPNNLLQTVPHQ